MNADMRRAILFMSAYSVPNGSNKCRATDIMIKSPCKCHPETGKPCDMVGEDKRNSVCYSCKYVGGHLPPTKETQYFYDRNENIAPTDKCRVEMCINNAQQVIEGIPVCRTCASMVRKRLQRRVPEDRILLPSRKKGKKWSTKDA